METNKLKEAIEAKRAELGMPQSKNDEPPNEPVNIPTTATPLSSDLEEATNDLVAVCSDTPPPKLREICWTVENEGVWRRSGVGQRHFNQPPLEGSWGECYKKLRSELFSGMLYALVGPRGTGKTQLSACLIRHVCSFVLESRYTTAIECFVDIRRAYNLDQIDEREILNLYEQPTLLVIDELQDRGETDWEDRMLSHIVDRRYRSMKDTILIANLARDEFESSIGSSIVDRIIECGQIIECDWPSFRQAKS